MRPEKLTEEGRAYLREIAIRKSQIPAAKDIAGKLNISANYVRQLLSTIGRKLSNDRAISDESKPAMIGKTRESR